MLALGSPAGLRVSGGAAPLACLSAAGSTLRGCSLLRGQDPRVCTLVLQIAGLGNLVALQLCYRAAFLPRCLQGASGYMKDASRLSAGTVHSKRSAVPSSLGALQSLPATQLQAAANNKLTAFRLN